MICNPCRAAQGGDVEGTIKTDVEGSVSSPLTIARASVEPGYELGASLEYGSQADLLRGYCTYGKSIGESTT